MNRGIKFRLTIFIVTIALLVSLIAWTTDVSWERINETHQKLTILQQQSFNIADHLQQVVLGLNNSVLRYAAYRDPQDWTNFTTAGRDLQRWLNNQQSILSTGVELPLVQQIQATYLNYLSAAGDIHAKVYGTHQAI